MTYRTAPPVDVVPPQPGVSDVDAAQVSEWSTDVILGVASRQPRQLQARLGPSEIGQRCRRRLAYRIAGTEPVNITDPVKSMFGTGFHHVMAEGLPWLSPGRYALEVPVTYRGISGTVDCYDRRRRRVVDWKTTSKRAAHRYATQGPSTAYVVQLAIYTEGLRAAGEDPQRMCLVFVPRDGGLDDVQVWVSPPLPELADKYIDRYEQLVSDVDGGLSPGLVDAAPSTLCPYCPNYRPGATNLDVACPGRLDEKEEQR